MNYELFVELFRAESKIDTDSEPEFLELTLDEQDYVAGGYFYKCCLV
jgi:hypothetical protein